MRKRERDRERHALAQIEKLFKKGVQAPLFHLFNKCHNRNIIIIYPGAAPRNWLGEGLHHKYKKTLQQKINVN